MILHFGSCIHVNEMIFMVTVVWNCYQKEVDEQVYKKKKKEKERKERVKPSIESGEGIYST